MPITALNKPGTLIRDMIIDGQGFHKEIKAPRFIPEALENHNSGQ